MMGYVYTAAYDRPLDGELTITITLAEYRELVRVSTLYEQERRGEPKPIDLDNIEEVE